MNKYLRQSLNWSLAFLPVKLFLMSRSQNIPDVLRKIGFHGNITFITKSIKIKRNKKNVNQLETIGFQPSYSPGVKKNAGRIFLKLIKEHFQKFNHFNKIWNKNTVKVSYSCIGNILSIILSHKKEILSPVSNTEYGCNCSFKESCFSQNERLNPEKVYWADIKNPAIDEKVLSWSYRNNL